MPLRTWVRDVHQVDAVLSSTAWGCPGHSRSKPQTDRKSQEGIFTHFTQISFYHISNLSICWMFSIILNYCLLYHVYPSVSICIHLLCPKNHDPSNSSGHGTLNGRPSGLKNEILRERHLPRSECHTRSTQKYTQIILPYEWIVLP